MKYFFFLLTLFPLIGFSQVKAFDKLEMLYDQGHYKMVYRKSKKLLYKPEYDYSLLPEYYKSISIFQLYQDEKWRKRNKKAIEEAKELFLKVREEDQGHKLFNAHYFEIQSLKKDFYTFLEQAKQQGNEELFTSTLAFTSEIFAHLPQTPSTENPKTEPIETADTIEETLPSKEIEVENTRKQIIAFAEQYLGTPYRWSGETPKGFDCSGFTSYVMKEFGKSIPRSAHEQYKSSTKIKLKKAKPGDLVFFDSGNGINHVGIVVANEDGKISMIHSSTSSGIIVTNIAQSKYWRKRIKAAGSYL